MIQKEELYIIHIIECLERVKSCSDKGKATFLSDRIIYDAVVRNLQTMAESTSRLGEALQQRHPNIPWHAIKGFRNILVHDYLGDINPEQCWNIINKYLPDLESAMKQELPKWSEYIAPFKV